MRVGKEIAIEENYGDSGFIEGLDNAGIGEVVWAEGLEGGEEDAGDFAGDILTAELECLLLTGAAFITCEGAAPEQCVFTRLGGVCHALADGLEDLGLSQIGNQEAEGEAAGGDGGFRLDIGAGSGPAVDQAECAEVADGSADCNTGGAEALDEVGFAGESVAGFELAGEDLAVELIEDALVLREFDPRHVKRDWYDN